jgi:O-antigen/teichoic acid export membrane protein
LGCDDNLKGDILIKQDIYKRILNDVTIVGFANMLISLSGIIIVPIITRILGVQDYGLYVQLTVTVSLIGSFATLGLPYAMVRFLSGEKDKDRISEDLCSSIALIAVFSVAISLVMLSFSDRIAESIFGNETSLVLIIAAIIPIECISFALHNMFRVFQEVNKYVILQLSKVYIEIAVIAAAAFQGYGIRDVALFILAVRFLFLLIIALIVMASIGWSVPRFSRMREYLKFSLPTIPSNVSSWIVNSSDRYIIGIFLGLTYVGYYNPAYNLGALIQMFMTPINFVLVSLVAKYYEEGKIDQLKELFKYSTKYYLLLSIPACFGLSILSKPILNMISTAEMAENSYLVVPLSALSYLIMGFGGVGLGFACYMKKKTHIDMMNWIIIALLNIGLNLLLVPKIGIVGAALATLIASLAGAFFGFYFAFKYFDFDFDYKSMAKAIAASLVMYAFLAQIHPVGLMQILLTVLVGAIIYIAASVLMRLITKDELLFLKSSLKWQR